MELELASEGHQGAHEVGGRTQGGGARPHPRGWWVAPSSIFFAPYFLLIPNLTSVEFQDFWSCAE